MGSSRNLGGTDTDSSRLLLDELARKQWKERHGASCPLACSPALTGAVAVLVVSVSFRAVIGTRMEPGTWPMWGLSRYLGEEPMERFCLVSGISLPVLFLNFMLVFKHKR